MKWKEVVQEEREIESNSRKRKRNWKNRGGGQVSVVRGQDRGWGRGVW